MSLKCPICGNEYRHDSKICHVCDNKWIKGVESKVQRWNCGIFLEFPTITFGRHRSNETSIKIASEPKFSDFKPIKEYIWNCSFRNRFRNFYTSKLGISEIRNIRQQKVAAINECKQEINNPMIYE